MKIFDVIVIGGGQSALACAYFLSRTGLDYLIFDDQEQSGGAWQHAWDSLTLFSPADHSSLPGWMMPKSKSEHPDKGEVLKYLADYQSRYGIRIQRQTRVKDVIADGQMFTVISDRGNYQTRAVLSATGTFQKPFIPDIPGKDTFKGIQLHSAHYQNTRPFEGRKVLIVGGGNSGAQILAEVSRVATTSWATVKVPEFLPDDVDGRVLFDVASAKYHALKEGRDFQPSHYNIGNIVMVPPVREARQRGVLVSRDTFEALYEDGVIWPDGKPERFDVIIWCTGFGFATDHLRSLGILNEKGTADCVGTRSSQVSGLWLVGYGSFTGFASATLIGVGRSARQTVNEVVEYIKLNRHEL